MDHEGQRENLDANWSDFEFEFETAVNSHQGPL